MIAAALLLPVLLSLLLANKVLVAAGVMEQGRNGPPFLEEKRESAALEAAAPLMITEKIREKNYANTNHRL